MREIKIHIIFASCNGKLFLAKITASHPVVNHLSTACCQSLDKQLIHLILGITRQGGKPPQQMADLHTNRIAVH